MNGSRESDIVRISEGLREGTIDHITIESPLSIQIIHANIQYSMGLTMRTPGHDDSLVIGFLYDYDSNTEFFCVETCVYDSFINTVNLRFIFDFEPSLIKIRGDIFIGFFSVL